MDAEDIIYIFLLFLIFITPFILGILLYYFLLPVSCAEKIGFLLTWLIFTVVVEGFYIWILNASGYL